MTIDEFWMEHAISLAHKAQQAGEVPIGAVLIKDNEIIAEGFNQSIMQCDPTLHAEICAIRTGAEKLRNYRLVNTTLYVTLEPCAMCAGAIIQARIARIVFGTRDPKGGAAGSVFNVLQNPLLNHCVNITEGILKNACAKILIDFFKTKRNNPVFLS